VRLEERRSDGEETSGEAGGLVGFLAGGLK